jgi:AcrR family transcriptional regulator
MTDAVTPGTAAMQSKSELIVAAARKLFLIAGYEVTSMDAIAAEAGVSKATVYSHFQSKEALFAGVMHDMCEDSGGPKISGDLAGPPEVVLRIVGETMTYKLADQKVMDLLRTVLCGAVQFPDLGRTFWNEGPNMVMGMLANYLGDLARRGAAHVPDSDLASRQFFGLVTGPFLLPILLNVRPVPSRAELDRALESAIAAFLAGIAPAPR